MTHFLVIFGHHHFDAFAQVTWVNKSKKAKQKKLIGSLCLALIYKISLEILNSQNLKILIISF